MHRCTPDGHRTRLMNTNLAHQVGLDPTALRLTAEPLVDASRCKHNNLHAPKSNYLGIWGDSGGTPPGRPARLLESVSAVMKISPNCNSNFNDTMAFCRKDISPLVFQPGTVLRGKYQIISQIGRGGMAVVYRAHHILLNEEKALKVLLQTDEQAFRREAQVLCRLRHPHIARIEDADVMEDIFTERRITGSIRNLG